MKRCRSAALESQSRKRICKVTPRMGSALIFRHDLLHEGAPLLSGVKYILRTELIFTRIPSILSTHVMFDLSSIQYLCFLQVKSQINIHTSIWNLEDVLELQKERRR